MRARYDRRVSYDEFVGRVRRHRPTELLPTLARTACEYFEREAWTADRLCVPWALAAAAKVSIVMGNEHRSSGVTEGDVREICAAYAALDDPLARQGETVTDSLGAFLVRTFNEQFLSQQSYFEEISRLGALFESLDAIDTEILTSSLIKEILGFSVGEFVCAGFVLAVSAVHTNGRFNPDWPSLSVGPGAIDPHFPTSTVRDVFETHFLTSFERVRGEAREARQADRLLRHLEYNPLVGRPYVELPTGEYLAPQPHLAFQKLSPAALYYRGIERHGAAFSRDFGAVFQEYCGRQLGLVPGVTVLPEVFYGNDQRSVDWFVVADDVVLLIEVKTTRLTHLARIGGERLATDVDRSLGRAFRQINRTNALLDEGHPALGDIPTDRPRLGMVVTLEPYWAANSSFIRRFLPEPALAVTVASARELEHLVDVARSDGGVRALSEIASDPDRRTWNLGNALPAVHIERNPILEAAWSGFPWPDQAAVEALGEAPSDSHTGAT